MSVELTDEELDAVLHLLRDEALDALDNARACKDRSSRRRCFVERGTR